METAERWRWKRKWDTEEVGDRRGIEGGDILGSGKEKRKREGDNRRKGRRKEKGETEKEID